MRIHISTLIQEQGFEQALSRFWSYVTKSSSCWTWTGFTNNGYGQVRVLGQKMSIHVFSYEYHKGDIPNGYEVDHLCRNPACVNPDHLEAVTPQVNQRRGYAPSGINSRKTHCNQGHEFTEANTYIGINRRLGKPYRSCRQCHAVTQKLYRQRMVTLN